MANGLITATANAVLDHILGGGDFTRDATLYAALMTVAPDDDGTGGTEASGTDYAREAVTNNSTNFPAASARGKANGTEIDFGVVGAGGWGTIVGVALFTASSGGTMRAYADLAVPQPTAEGNPVYFEVGGLTFSIPWTA
jgi:hypothetical protein